LRWNEGAQDLGKDLGSYAEVGTDCETDDNTSTEVRRPALEENRSSSENSAATTQADEISLSEAADIEAAAWWKAALAVIGILADTGVEFDCDDLLALVGDPPKGRQLSVAFAVMRRRHVIVPTGAIIRGSRLLWIWIGAS
jgi:hypothetical protein